MCVYPQCYPDHSSISRSSLRILGSHQTPNSGHILEFSTIGCCCYCCAFVALPNFLDCRGPRGGQCRNSILQSLTFALRSHIRLPIHQICISFIEQLSTMAPRNLLQDTVKYNHKITLIRKMLKSRKCSQSLLSLRSTQSTPSGMSARVPVEPIKAIRKYLSSTKDQAEPQEFAECQCV